ncbi:MAG: hypothetical protein QM820_20060 [Minicystis sp.]
MDVSPATLRSSAAEEDDVNVKSNYVDCLPLTRPRKRALPEPPKVPPLVPEDRGARG